jgi:hypothetical protein
MKKMHGRLLWMFSLAVLFASFAFAASLTEEQKIDALIHSIEVLPDAQFIRNGNEHDGKAAAEHLRQKRRYAGDRIKTASDFIACCASRSSVTGEPYRIRFANGETVDAEAFLRAELKRIEASPAEAR